MKIPYALRGEELVDPTEFDTGGRKPGIVCPGCKAPLVAKIGLGIREPHFAHLPDRTARCEFRTVLHRIAVRLLARQVARLIHAGGKLFLQWRCPACGCLHQANVLDGIRSSALAEQVGTARPDLSLHAGGSSAGLPRAVIHVGDRMPNAERLTFYQEERIQVWLLPRPEDAAEAEAMRGATKLTATGVLGVGCQQPAPEIKPRALPSPPAPLHRSFLPRITPPPAPVEADPVPYPGGCPACGKNLQRRHLYVEWRYPEREGTEKIAVVMLGNYGATAGPSAFTAKELQIAAAHGSDTANRGRLFYEHLAEILTETSAPVGSFSRGCPGCGQVVPDAV